MTPFEAGCLIGGIIACLALLITVAWPLRHESEPKDREWPSERGLR